jgi:two-component system, response regulator PdtaR
MNAKARRILIAEDEGLLVLQLRMMLEGWGYEVTDCVSGAEEAVAAARRDDPGLIVLDIGLARRTSGMEAARSIRAFSEAFILFVSGYPEDQVADQVRELGPSALLRKPFNESGFRRAFDMAMGAAPRDSARS